MFIAHVDFDIAPQDRQRALDTLLAEASAVRAMPGNRVFRPHCDPLSDTHVGVVHEWDSAEAFSAYVASPGFKASGEVLRPMMTGNPSSRRFDATLLEVVR